MAGLIIRPRARILHGHDWVYASEVQKTFGDPKNGDVISLRDGRDRLLGSAIYNSKSQIIARRFSRQRQELDADFYVRRLRQAIEYRRLRGVNLQVCRLVWSESDGVPGLIVDRYGNTLVIQTLTLAMDLRREMIAEALGRLWQDLAPGTEPVMVERNDAPVRKAEGLELRTAILAGKPAPVEIDLDGLKFTIDPLHGQKTGFYLDQIDNYREVAAWAAGRRVLDCFANQGAFAIACAKRGAAHVRAVEIGGDCIRLINENAARNGVTVESVEANVFDHLKAEEARGAQYDLVILDPPSFTKSRDTVEGAMRGYKEIHLRAFKLLAPGGLLATFSCSHHVSGELLREVINDALVDAKKSARVLKTLHQSADHPILSLIPETEYLKGYLLEMAPGR